MNKNTKVQHKMVEEATVFGWCTMFRGTNAAGRPPEEVSNSEDDAQAAGAQPRGSQHEEGGDLQGIGRPALHVPLWDRGGAVYGEEGDVPPDGGMVPVEHPVHRLGSRAPHEDSLLGGGVQNCDWSSLTPQSRPPETSDESLNVLGDTSVCETICLKFAIVGLDEENDKKTQFWPNEAFATSEPSVQDVLKTQRGGDIVGVQTIVFSFRSRTWL